MTVKGRNKPRYGTPPMAQTGRAVQRPMTGLGIPLRQAEVADTFRAYQQPQAPTMPMSGTYSMPAAPPRMPQTAGGFYAAPPQQLPFYNKTPGMQAPIKIPRPRPRTQRMPTTLPTRRPQGQFMMDRQGRPVRTVPFINKTGRG